MIGPFFPRVLPVEPAIDLGIHKDTILDVYFAFLILGGQIGLPIALLSMFFNGTGSRRHPTLINVLFSWMLYAVANLLLLYAGESRSAEPNFGLCLIQASLIYGSTVNVACATFCLVLQLWMEFRGIKLAKDSRKCSAADIQLLIAPWLSFLVIATISVLYGSLRPSSVSIQWTFYCTISSKAVIYSVEACTLVFLALTLVFEVIVLRKIYDAARQSRAVNQSSYHLTLRVTAFTAYSILTFIVSIIITFNPKLVFAYLFTATLPLAAFLIFGTQRENLTMWFRCLFRRRQQNAPLPPMTFKPAVIVTLPQSTTGSSFEPNSDKRIPLSPKSQEVV